MHRPAAQIIEPICLQNAIFPCDFYHAAISRPPPCLTQSLPLSDCLFLHQQGQKTALEGISNLSHARVFFILSPFCKYGPHKHYKTHNINKLHFLSLETETFVLQTTETKITDQNIIKMFSLPQRLPNFTIKPKY